MFSPNYVESALLGARNGDAQAEQRLFKIHPQRRPFYPLWALSKAAAAGHFFATRYFAAARFHEP
jgi:hypothetical protein